MGAQKKRREWTHLKNHQKKIKLLPRWRDHDQETRIWASCTHCRWEAHDVHVDMVPTYCPRCGGVISDCESV